MAGSLQLLEGRASAIQVARVQGTLRRGTGVQGERANQQLQCRRPFRSVLERQSPQVALGEFNGALRIVAVQRDGRAAK